MPSIGAFVESAGDSVAPGIYRVVGTGEEIALLRVGDRDGRRAYTGEVVTVSRGQFDGNFELVAEPRRPVSALRILLAPVRNVYWSIYAAWLSIRRWVWRRASGSR